MLALCRRLAAQDLPVFLLGSTPAVLARLVPRLEAACPGLRVVGSESPPFRPLSVAEDAALVTRIRDSGAAAVFVGLGCPKQEAWLAAHRERIPAVLLAVGAAFDFHAGLVTRAPAWMRRSGLEWLHRLLSEPQRLWRRYLLGNSLFILWYLVSLGGRLPRSARPPGKRPG